MWFGHLLFALFFAFGEIHRVEFGANAGVLLVQPEIGDLIVVINAASRGEFELLTVLSHMINRKAQFRFERLICEVFHLGAANHRQHLASRTHLQRHREHFVQRNRSRAVFGPWLFE